jgi:hypothetical protein
MRNAILPLSLFAALLISSSCAEAAEDEQKAVLFVGDFETGFKGWGRREATAGCFDPEVMAGRARAGEHAIRSYVRVADGADLCQSEVIGPTALPGQERWYAFSIYLPKDYRPDDTWGMYARWQPLCKDERKPVLQLSPPKTDSEGAGWDFPGRWWIVTRAAADKTEDGDEGSEKSIGLGPGKRGGWTDFVFRVKWSRDDGLLQVWQDGVLLVDRTSPTTFGDKGVRFRLGIYKGHGRVERTIAYFDEFRLGGPGATYEDVAPPGPEAQPAAAEK